MTPDLLLPRRRLLAGGLAGTALAIAGGRAVFAQTPGAPGVFVFIILRGAMDGLAALAPVSDPRYRDLRGSLALPESGAPGAGAMLGQGFMLHPRLATLAGMWREGSLRVMHACATPYRERSHFDGQDMLESGAARWSGGLDGWLNRAIGLLPQTGERNREGVGIGRTIPLVLRGANRATSWAPPLAPETDADTLGRLMDLYAYDPLLGPALSRAVATDALADQGNAAMAGDGGRRGSYAPLSQAAARILTAPGGPSAAVISLDGWDTHAGQGSIEGALAGRLGQLDEAIAALRTGMGPMWANTHVVVASEFGRTVRVNGTGGTDHGTGGLALHFGGAVREARMLGDWPGLSRLHEDRDLIPANDVRTLFADALSQAWRLDPERVRRAVMA